MHKLVWLAHKSSGFQCDSIINHSNTIQSDSPLQTKMCKMFSLKIKKKPQSQWFYLFHHIHQNFRNTLFCYCYLHIVIRITWSCSWGGVWRLRSISLSFLPYFNSSAFQTDAGAAHLIKRWSAKTVPAHQELELALMTNDQSPNSNWEQHIHNITHFSDLDNQKHCSRNRPRGNLVDAGGRPEWNIMISLRVQNH